jgi:hypothetical protein
MKQIPSLWTIASNQKNWETPEAGNSWKEAILNEIGNLLNFKVFDVVTWEDVSSTERV